MTASIPRHTRHTLARAARAACLAAASAGLLAACGSDDDLPATNNLPAGLATVGMTVYPATTAGTGSTAATQDLLTGGLGRTGLGLAVAPAYADPANPTAAELRRNALYSNYRGLVDPTVGGGYGSFYGPNVDVNGVAGSSEGLIPGREYVAVLDDGTGTKQVTIAVQIPDSFNTAAPCIVLGPSSGSRGVYGAISSAGEWGLKRGCAVALTDAGKGVGLYDPADDTVHKVDGTRATRTAAGALSTFAANGQRHRTGRLQRRLPEPHCAQAGVLAAQCREGLGRRHPGRCALCVVGHQRPLRQCHHAGTLQCRQHAGDGRLGFERWGGGDPRGRARWRGPDRWRGGGRARHRDAHRERLWHQLRRRGAKRLRQDAWPTSPPTAMSTNPAPRWRPGPR
jgi:hypothetical protein